MAEWSAVSSDYNDGDFTFDLATGEQQLPEVETVHPNTFCIKCRTMAKMAVYCGRERWLW